MFEFLIHIICSLITGITYREIPIYEMKKEAKEMEIRRRMISSLALKSLYYQFDARLFHCGSRCVCSCIVKMQRGPETLKHTKRYCEVDETT